MKKWDGLVPFRDGDLWGLVDSNYEVIVEPKFTGLNSKFENYLVVKNDQGCGIIDLEGNVIVPFVERGMRFLPSGLVKTYYDEYGEQYEGLLSTNGGKLKFLPNIIKGSKKFWKYQYQKGYDIGFVINEGKRFKIFLLFLKVGVFHLVDKNGDFVNPILLGNYVKQEVGNIIHLYTRYFSFSINNKKGFIDNNGKVLIPFIYDEISILNQHLLTVKLNEKVAISDRFGNFLTPLYMLVMGKYLHISQKILTKFLQMEIK
jgi:hypothetical protein